MTFQFANKCHRIAISLILRYAVFPADPRRDNLRALAFDQALPDPRSDAVRSEDNTAAGMKKRGPVLA